VVAGGDVIPAPETITMAEVTTSLAMSETAASGPAASTAPAVGAPSSPTKMVAATASAGADDNAVEEPKVIMGHPGLRESGTISLSEVMGTTHFALNQAHDVLHRKREDTNEERLRLSVWVSLSKKWTTCKREKAEVRQKCLDKMEILYSRRQVVVDKLDAQS
jgi:hypothetical protein